MTNLTTQHTISPEDLIALKNAKLKMEQVGWAMKGLNKMGNFIEDRINFLPKKQQDWIQQVTYKVLHTVIKTNLLSMKQQKLKTSPLNKTYKALAASSGVIGGALGASAFAVDLGITTKLMMRSIMDIARNQGEDLQDYDTQLACLQVFALGGKSKHDDNLETSYYATRIALNTSAKGGIKALEGILLNSANPIVKVVGSIAAKFSLQVSEKFVAQAIPVIGAAGGAGINLAFMNHFQKMAQAHFTIRHLERKYNHDIIKVVYEGITIKG